MMEVQVFINGRCIASADATNVSGLAEISDYQCFGKEAPSKFTEGFGTRSFKIEKHPREQSCWALVAKMATALQQCGGQK